MDKIKPGGRRPESESNGVTACRGVRGATSVDDPADGAALGEVVGEMLGQILQDNRAAIEDIAAVIFTITDDLQGINPAAAARQHGFQGVPLLVVRENGGDHRVAHCLRVLLLLNTKLSQAELSHAYLRGARVLRPDLLRAGADNP
ncbi:MAG TPA: chorismate mutase [Candidatus Dormibacteraeota bacterium]|nr:chorismate mutase [Candidatus Dormibacteraeota bacterium]